MNRGREKKTTAPAHHRHAPREEAAIAMVMLPLLTPCCCSLSPGFLFFCLFFYQEFLRYCACSLSWICRCYDRMMPVFSSAGLFCMIAFMGDPATNNPNHFMCTPLGSAHERDFRTRTPCCQGQASCEAHNLWSRGLSLTGASCLFNTSCG